MKYVVCLAFVGATTATAQSPVPTATSDQLLETVAQLDAKMFAALNAHDVDRLMSMFTDDLSFITIRAD